MKGSRAHPVYVWLKEATAGVTPSWNFGKYLVSPDGETVEFHSHQIPPGKLAERIQLMLEEHEAKKDEL